MFDPITILTALLPIVTQGGKALIRHFFGSKSAPIPQNADEYVKMKQVDIQQLQALSSMEGDPTRSSFWLNDVRGMLRPTAVVVVLLLFAYGMVDKIDEPYITMLNNLTSSVVFYLFGDRTLMYLNKK